MKAKIIEYAYPTSTTATNAGYGKQGCWYVKTYDSLDTLHKEKPLAFFTKKEDAVNYADSLPNPYSWLHKYF